MTHEMQKSHGSLKKVPMGTTSISALRQTNFIIVLPFMEIAHTTSADSMSELTIIFQFSLLLNKGVLNSQNK